MKLTKGCIECFSSLSAGTRLEIVDLLKNKGKMSVTDIVRNFSLSQPTITHHLRYLEDAGVIKSEKNGRFVFYMLAQKCAKGDCDVFA